jgi:hypothetical protein
MKDTDMQQIIEAVTRQVLAAMGNNAPAACTQDNRVRYLVVGDCGQVPSKLCGDALLEGPDAFEKQSDILRYGRVIITALDLVQLADLAQGRPGDTACRAIIEALLNGIEVVMVETALEHRKYAGKSSTGLYTVLENHVKTVQGFGVKLLTRDKLCDTPVPAAKPPKFGAAAALPVQGSAGTKQRVITERDALAMSVGAKGSVSVERGTVITPSAQDVFRRAGLTVEYTGR